MTHSFPTRSSSYLSCAERVAGAAPVATFNRPVSLDEVIVVLDEPLTAFVVGHLAQLGQTLEVVLARRPGSRSEEHTSELQSLMRISYAVFCLTKKNNH